MLLKGLKDHPALRILKINVPVSSFGHDYADLRQLLKDNRKIAVTNDEGTIYTDGCWIDEMYSLNRFFRGSAALSGGPASERPSMISTALVERASKDFRRSALLLNDQMDALKILLRNLLGAF